MSNKKEAMRGNSELFDWMLAIDFDPAKCKGLLRNALNNLSP